MTKQTIAKKLLKASGMTNEYDEAVDEVLYKIQQKISKKKFEELTREIASFDDEWDDAVVYWSQAHC